MTSDERRHRLIEIIRRRYGDAGVIPLHAPIFAGREKDYLAECIDSTFVSSVGAFVVRFEEMIREITGARFAIATVNGTTALEMALRLAGVKAGDEVVTQPLTFVATCNAVAHLGAVSSFVDIDETTLGLSPVALSRFFERHAEKRADGLYNRTTGRRIAAVVPMHVFGLPMYAAEVAEVCRDWGVPMVEDAAEALGSSIEGRAAGGFGLLGALSFNGNKITTCGGGGCIVTDDEDLAVRAKHLTTTAKRPHPWEFFHDEVGFNYRMPNLNAALACAQLEQLPQFLANKRSTADYYHHEIESLGLPVLRERDGARSNYWLNAVLMDDRADRDAFLAMSNEQGVQTRPVWVLMHRLPAFADAFHDDLSVAEAMEGRIVNLPSSVLP